VLSIDSSSGTGGTVPFRGTWCGRPIYHTTVTLWPREAPGESENGRSVNLAPRLMLPIVLGSANCIVNVGAGADPNGWRNRQIGNWERPTRVGLT